MGIFLGDFWSKSWNTTYTPINQKNAGLWKFQNMFWDALRCTNNMTYSVSANTEFWDFCRFWADFSTVFTGQLNKIINSTLVFTRDKGNREMRRWKKSHILDDRKFQQLTGVIYPCGCVIFFRCLIYSILFSLVFTVHCPTLYQFLPAF